MPAIGMVIGGICDFTCLCDCAGAFSALMLLLGGTKSKRAVKRVCVCVCVHATTVSVHQWQNG